jgi:hypothetical protein
MAVEILTVYFKRGLGNTKKYIAGIIPPGYSFGLFLN